MSSFLHSSACPEILTRFLFATILLAVVQSSAQTATEQEALAQIGRAYLIYSVVDPDNGLTGVLKRSDFDGKGGVTTTTIKDPIGSQYFGLNNTGDRIVFLKGNDVTGAIWMCDARGGGEVQVGSKQWPNVSNLKFAKTSNDILFTSDTQRAREQAPLTAKCWLLSPEGAEQKLLDLPSGHYKYLGDMQLYDNLFTYRYDARVKLVTFPGMNAIADFGKTCETDISPDGNMIVTNTTNHKGVNLHRTDGSSWQKNFKTVWLFDWKTGEYRWAVNDADWIVANPEDHTRDIWAFNWRDETKVRLTFEDPVEGGVYPIHGYLFIGGSPVSLSVTQPEAGQKFDTGSDIPITATASSDEGAITKIEIHNGAELIHTASGASAHYTWPAPPRGEHELTLTATDVNENTVETVVNVIVRDAPTPTSIEIADQNIAVPPGGQFTFTAVVLDQHGDPMQNQPMTWSVTGGGQIDAQTGEYRAPSEETTGITISVVSGSLSASTQITAAMSLAINFQEGLDGAPAGVLVDDGSAYGDRGNGYTYGWNADNTANSRIRSGSENYLYRSLNHMELNGSSYFWEIAAPAGLYDVRIVAADPEYPNGVWKIDVEGELLIDHTPSSSAWMAEETGRVTVTDGRLTVDLADGAQHPKLAYIEIAYAGETDVNPGQGLEIRVVDVAGNPIENAMARLSEMGVSARTNADGVAMVTIPSTASEKRLRVREFQSGPRIVDGNLLIGAGLSSRRIAVDVYTLSGSLVSAVRREVQAGKRTVPLGVHALGSGVYVARIALPDATHTIRVRSLRGALTGGSISNGVVRANASLTRGMARKAQAPAIDTLYVTKSGYMAHRTAIESYSDPIPLVRLSDGKTCADVQTSTPLCVLQPNGGETFRIGDRIDVYAGGPDTDGVDVLLYLSVDQGRNYYQLPMTESLPVEAGVGVYSYTIPSTIRLNSAAEQSTVSTGCLIRVEHYDIKEENDISDGYFTISE